MKTQKESWIPDWVCDVFFFVFDPKKIMFIVGAFVTFYVVAPYVGLVLLILRGFGFKF